MVMTLLSQVQGRRHLPGMVASMTTLPVIGVPIESKSLKGLDSLLSIVQMPGGIPVATTAIGKSGAKMLEFSKNARNKQFNSSKEFGKL